MKDNQFLKIRGNNVQVEFVLIERGSQHIGILNKEFLPHIWRESDRYASIIIPIYKIDEMIMKSVFIEFVETFKKEAMLQIELFKSATFGE